MTKDMRAGNLKYRLQALTSLLVLVSSLMSNSAQSQSLVTEQESGWVNDIRGMRHFSGLRCPDTVGNLSRTKVLAADADRQAGCIYSGDGGFSAILRQHLSGTGTKATKDFLKAYKAAGFTQVSLSGPAATGVSFNTRDWTETALCETLWHFMGQKADYTLWMAYSLPTQEEEIGPAVHAFTDILVGQN